MPGSLCVVGTGIKSISHITSETRIAIINADKLLYLVADYLTQDWLQKMNSSAEDLHPFYSDRKPRAKTYEEMTAHILQFVRDGKSVCAAFYGHPGVFAAPTHAAIVQARKEGFAARMLPGISAEDCLFAELGIDPAKSGCQSFETTDFLIYNRKFDPACNLILWQVGVIGNFDYRDLGYDTSSISILVQYLGQFYPEDHEVVLFEAATYNLCEDNIQRLRLRELLTAPLTSSSTLYVPPSRKLVSAKPEILAALKVSPEHVTIVKNVSTASDVLSNSIPRNA
jgi:uncharacterized protein YabN with tetrapyrrole methylase and pyrophosphatase domain